MQLAGRRKSAPRRTHLFGISIWLLLALGSCVTQPSDKRDWFPVNCKAYDQADPIVRSRGFSGVQRGLGLMNDSVAGESYDAGITIERTQSWMGEAKPLYPWADAFVRAAFDVNSLAVQIGNVSINGTDLSYHTCSGEAMSLSPQVYIGYDTAAYYGEHDSMEISYSNFAGSSFASKTAFGDFGKFTLPDTIVISKGFTMPYEKFFSRDSLVVNFYYVTMIVPDTGAVVFPPNFVQLATDSQALNISVSRSHFATIISPQGKRIGVSTTQFTDDTLIQARLR